ncbi:MAG: anti-sigma-I factor RsgI family protein [Oscillospiraceae bacterium]
MKENNVGKLRQAVPIILAIGLIAVVFFGLIFFTSQKDKDNNYVVSVDVNPSIKISLDNRLVVKSVMSLNDKAQPIVLGDNFVNSDIGNTVSIIIENLVKENYLVNGNTILVSLYDENNKDIEDVVEDKISTLVLESLQKNNVTAKVYNQKINLNSQIDLLSKSYGISKGKMSFIKNVILHDNTLIENELVKMNIGDIDKLIKDRGISLDIDDLNVYTYDFSSKNIYYNDGKKVDLLINETDNQRFIDEKVNEFTSKYNTLNTDSLSGNYDIVMQNLKQLGNEIDIYEDILEIQFKNNSINPQVYNETKLQLDNIDKSIDILEDKLKASQQNSTQNNNQNNVKPPIQGESNNSNNTTNLDKNQIESKVKGFEVRAAEFKNAVNSNNYYNYKAQIDALNNEADAYENLLENHFKSSQLDSVTYYNAKNRIDKVENILDKIEDKFESDD